MTKASKINGNSNPAYKHGFCRNKTKEYNTWVMMRQRCYNPRNKDYKDYGGRGIKICKEWESFSVFLDDMGVAPSKSHSIDRMNNDGDYTPNNCKWRTCKFQCNHTRKNILITHNDQTKTLAQWSDTLNIGYSTLHKRYRLKWSAERILTTTP